MKKQYTYLAVALIIVLTVLFLPLKSNVDLELEATAFHRERPDIPVPVTVTVQGKITNRLLRPYRFTGTITYPQVIQDLPGNPPEEAAEYTFSMKDAAPESFPGEFLSSWEDPQHMVYGSIWMEDGFDSFILTQLCPIGDGSYSGDLIIAFPEAESLTEVYARAEK